MSTSKPLDEKTLELADKLDKQVKLHHKDPHTVDADTYLAHLPPTLNKEIIKELQDYNTVFTAAMGHVVGTQGNALMEKHKDLTNVEVQVPLVGKDKMFFNYQRSRSVPDGKGGTRDSFGILTVQYDFYGTHKAGELAKVRAGLAEAATKAFGN